MIDETELSNLSLEKLIQLIPIPPAAPPIIKVDRRVRGSLYINEKGTIPRTSSIPACNQTFDFQQFLSYASAVELENDGRKFAYSMIVGLPQYELNEQLNKVYSSVSSSRGFDDHQKKEKKEKKEKKDGKASKEKSPNASLKKSGSFKSMGLSLTKAIKRNSDTDRVSPQVSNSFLTFGLKESLCPLNEDMVEDIIITCKSGKSRYTIKLPPPSPTYTLSVTPESGSIRKGKDLVLTVTLNIKSTIHLEEVFTVEIVGFGRLFFVISLQSERSVFGEDIRQYFDKGVVKIPPVLDTLRTYFDSNGGFKKEKIFINPGNDEDTLMTRDQLNRDTFTECRDIYCIPTLILTWFKELSQPLLSSISESLLISATGEYECLSVLDMLKEPQKTIFKWVLELLADCQFNFEHHQVDIKQLASIFASALYTPSSADPVKNEKLVAKLENLIIQLVNYRLKLRA